MQIIMVVPHLVLEKTLKNTPVSDVRTESGIFMVGVFTLKTLWSVEARTKTMGMYVGIKDRSMSYVSSVLASALSLLQWSKIVGVGRTNGRCRTYSVQFFSMRTSDTHKTFIIFQKTRGKE